MVLSNKTAVTVTAIVCILLFIVDFASGCGGCGGGGGPPPRHGGWGSWQPSSWYATPCYGGLKTRRRYCNNPSPAHGGHYCHGSSTWSIDCNECSNANGGCEHKCVNYHRSFTCECYPGYQRWQSNWKLCERIMCSISSWPTPKNGYSSCSGPQVRYGTTCTITCNHGYNIQGPSYSLCGAGGNWSPSSSPICQVSACSPLHPPDNGEITPSICKTRPLHEQTCHYECNQGYTIIGPSSTTCDDEHWTQGDFQCRDTEPPSFGETCPSSQTAYADQGKTTAMVSWGPVTATDNDYASVSVSPAVTSPHEFTEGSHTVIYTAVDPTQNTKLCHLVVTVQVLRCQVFSPPANGKLESGMCGNVYGSICRVQCNKGYNLIGSVERTCDILPGTSQVHWTGSAYCKAVECPSLNTLSNTIMSGYGCGGSLSIYGTSCFFRCKLGYEVAGGSLKRTCKENGKWSGTPLICQGVTCPVTTVKSEGLIIKPPACANPRTSLGYGTQCRFSCKIGYQLLGPTAKTCSQSKHWSPIENPSCQDVSGPKFSNCPSSVTKTADRNTTSTTVTWTTPTATDNSGFVPKVTHFGKQPGEIFAAGEHSIRYIASDKTGNVGKCKFKVIIPVIRCIPNLYAPAGGTKFCTKNNIYGSECSFTCPIGHIMIGSATRVCERNASTTTGFWTGSKTQCELIRCPRLHPPPNSILAGCGVGPHYNVFGDKCFLYCDIGYQKKNGSTDRSCQADGTWSGQYPYCEAVRCQSLEAPKNGSVSPSSCTAFPGYGTVCHFSCGKGYMLHGNPILSCLSDGQWAGANTVSCKDVESPSFGLTCPSNIKRFADRGKTFSVVTWPTVTVTDNSGIVSNVTTSGVKSVYFTGTHLVTYNATDEAGNSKICNFYITVEVLRCQTLLPPLNGFIDGTCDNSYGSTCRMGCKDGYDLIGVDNITCENTSSGPLTGEWDDTIPVCKGHCGNQTVCPSTFAHPCLLLFAFPHTILCSNHTW